MNNTIGDSGAITCDYKLLNGFCIQSTGKATDRILHLIGPILNRYMNIFGDHNVIFKVELRLLNAQTKALTT